MKDLMRNAQAILVIGVASLSLVGGCSAEGRIPNNATSDPASLASTCKQPFPSDHSPDNTNLVLTLSKNEAKPGDEIRMMIVSPQYIEGIRGLTSYLECWDGSQWVPQFVLIAGIQSSPPLAVPFDEHPVVPDIGISVLQPELIKIPEKIPLGLYRITKSVTIKAGGVSQAYTLYSSLQIVE